MTHPLCPTCGLRYGSRMFPGALDVCRCEPYTPVMDRVYPDTAATEIQRLFDLAASQAREIAKLQTGHDLYEVVRRMSVPHFRNTYVLNRTTGKPFDEIVASMAHEFGLTVRK